MNVSYNLPCLDGHQGAAIAHEIYKCVSPRVVSNHELDFGL
jgi:hypothetical protein